MATHPSMSEQRLITRDVLRKMVRYAFPAFMASFLVFFMNFINYIFMAMFMDYTKIATYGVVSAYTTLAAGFFAPLATGTGLVMERARKDNDPHKIQNAINTSMLSTVIVGVLSTLAAILLSKVYVIGLHTPEEIVPETITFLRYFSFTYIPILYFSVTTVILNQLGEHTPPILAEVSAIALHFGFGYIFVGLFDWGLTGCAVSAVIAQTTAGVINTHIILQVRRRLNARTPTQIDRKLYLEVIREERTGIITTILGGFFAVFMQYFINELGITVIAAFSLFFVLQEALFVPIHALRTPARRLSAEYYESGSNRELMNAVTPMLLLAVVYTLLLIPLLQLIGPPVFMMLSHDPDVTIVGMRLLTLVSHYYAFYAATTLLSSSLEGLGQNRLTMSMNIGFNYFVRFLVLIACVFVIHGEESIAICYPASWAISAGALVIYYYATYPFFGQKKYSL